MPHLLAVLADSAGLGDGALLAVDGEREGLVRRRPLVRRRHHVPRVDVRVVLVTAHGCRARRAFRLPLLKSVILYFIILIRDPRFGYDPIKISFLGFRPR